MDFAIDKFNEERFGLVTGSRCTVLFPLKGNGEAGMRSYAKSLANEKFFKHYDEVSTWQMEHGSLCEHTAFEYYQDHFNKNIEKGAWCRREECGGTTDAHLEGEYGIDFKCPTSLQKWLDYLHEPLDKQQIDQCQMYMYLTGLPVWEIAAYLEETQFMSSNGLVYPVPQNKRMIRIRTYRDHQWEEKLQAPLEFVIRERNMCYDRLKEHFGNIQ
jgi:hypothetical protein